MDLATKIEAICNVFNTVVAVGGAIAILLQVKQYLETRAAEVEVQRSEDRKKQEELVAKLYFADIDLNKVLFEHPRIARALYDDAGGDLFRSLDEDEKQKCRTACQMFGDMLEYYVMLESGLMDGGCSSELFDCWRLYANYLWDHSYAFKHLIVETEGAWTPRFKAKFPAGEIAAIAKGAAEIDRK